MSSALFRRNNSPSPDDHMIFPIDFDEPSSHYGGSLSLDAYNNLSSSPPAASSSSAYYLSSEQQMDAGVFQGMADVQSSLPEYTEEAFTLSHWLNDPELPALDDSSSPIPIRSPLSDPQTPPTFLPYMGADAFSRQTSFSPSSFAALHSLPRSLSPGTAFDDQKYFAQTLPPPLHLDAVAPHEVSLSAPTPAWATDLWETPQYLRHESPPAMFPSSADDYVLPMTKRQRIPPRRDSASAVAQLFQSASAPSHDRHSRAPSLARTYSRRAESVSVSDDRDATVRRKKRSVPSEEPPAEEISDARPSNSSENSAPTKSLLHPPKLAPSAWQLYFTDWIQRQQASSTRKLNVAQAAKEAGQEYASLTPEEKEPYKRRSQAAKETRERELAAYMRTLTPDDIKRENAFRTAQRKAGKSRKSNIKDPNAPKKPLSAYFMFLQRIRSDPQLVHEVFGDETETTKQSILAAAKWRSMTDDQRKPFLAQAEQEKLDYEAARRLYEEGTTGYPTNINFSILPGSPAESPFRALRPDPMSSESESEGFTTDDGLDHRFNFRS